MRWLSPCQGTVPLGTGLNPPSPAPGSHVGRISWMRSQGSGRGAGLDPWVHGATLPFQSRDQSRTWAVPCGCGSFVSSLLGELWLCLGLFPRERPRGRGGWATVPLPCWVLGCFQVPCALPSTQVPRQLVITVH